MVVSKDSDSSNKKKRLRDEIIRRLEAFKGEEKDLASAQVCRVLREAAPLFEARCIGIYAAVQWEIDVTPMVEDTRFADSALVMPRWNSVQNEYEFARVESLDQLGAGRFGIAEPSQEATLVGRQTIDAVLVPGLAFTRSGARLGRGGGYYDRLLEACSAVKVGVCHDCQLVDEIPREAWDREMNFVATPTQWISAADI